MAIRFLPILLLAAVVCVHSGTIKRNKRGFLARQGFCPLASKNPKIADVRLNYLGFPIVFDNKDCSRSECSDDSNCDGDMKCCANRCGAKVCTDAVREDHPCLNVRCPEGETCKVRHVKCVMPKCYSGDVLALGQPTCIPDPNAPKKPIKTAPLNDQRRPAPAQAQAPVQPAQPQVAPYQTPVFAQTYSNNAMGMYPYSDQTQAAPYLPQEPPQEIQQPQPQIPPQPQLPAQPPVEQQPEQEQQPQQDQNAPLEDLDSPSNAQPQAQPMYPSMPQQYLPQGQWAKKH